MRSISGIFLFIVFAIAPSFAGAENAPNLSGTWVIKLKQSDLGQVRVLGKTAPRQVDPGIGWPPGTGPDGSPTQESIIQSLLLGGVVKDRRLVILQTDKEIQVTRKFTIGKKEEIVAQKFALDG
jgi:hypothetical protein